MWIAYTDPSDTRTHRQNRVRINQYVGDQYRRRLREAHQNDSADPSNKKRGRRKKRVETPPASNLHVVSTVPSSQTQDLVPVLNKHIYTNHLDPFICEKVQGDFVHRALDYWIHVSRPIQVNSIGLNDPQSQNVLTAMLTWTRSSSLALEAKTAMSLSTVAGGLDVSDAIGRECSRHRSNVVRGIRERIEYGVTDELIFGILVLITIEGMVGLEHTRMHVKVLEDMIRYRGGLESVGTTVPGLEKWLQFACYWVLKKAKTFLSLSDQPETDQEPIEYPTVPLEPKVQKMVQRLPEPFQVMTAAGHLSIPTLRYLMQFVSWRAEVFNLMYQQTRSIDLRTHTFDGDIPPGLSAFEKILCMTVSALASDIAARHLKASFGLLRIPSQRFERLLSELLYRMNSTEIDVLIWATTIYSTPPDRSVIANEWSQALMRKLESRRPNLRSWKVTEPILRQYFWDDLCAVHWEKLWSEYEHDMAAQIYSISTLTRLGSMEEDDQTVLDHLGRAKLDDGSAPQSLPYLVPPAPPDVP